MKLNPLILPATINYADLARFRSEVTTKIIFAACRAIESSLQETETPRNVCHAEGTAN